ncbi:MAG: hypothetical protein FH748_14210 [Balneolaceae bacterium]|nr:hypothetical protein [Balneolaceae bacterium]
MKFHFKVVFVLLAVAIVSCSSKKEKETKSMFIKGKITVADSVDSSGDYSGIELLIPRIDSEGTVSDTLFFAETEKSGEFEGTASFETKSYYALVINRNGNSIGQLNVILAEDDTLNIKAELPGVAKTVSMQSKEYEAMKVFERTNRAFQRVLAAGNKGVLSDSVFQAEINKWPDLFWEVAEKNKETLAASLAIEKVAQLLNGWKNEVMMERIDAGLPADYVVGVAARYGKIYLADEKGLDAASTYLDSLIQISDNERVKELVLRNKIEMYFDSSRVQSAKKMLQEYEKTYTKPISKQWANNIRYDLNYLAPGVNVPPFSLVTLNGDTITAETMKGNAYILEISPLANQQYMADYDRTMVIYEIYKNYGLKLLTIPLDQSQVTVDAFFEERRKAWPVAKIGSFDVQSIIEKFNVTQVPTRFLVDQNGVLVRKYDNREFSEVIQALNRTLKNKNNESIN